MGRLPRERGQQEGSQNMPGLKEIPCCPKGLFGVEEPDGTITCYKVERTFAPFTVWSGWTIVFMFQNGTWCRAGELDARGFESSERIRLLLLMISRDPAKYRALYEKSLQSSAAPHDTPKLRDAPPTRQ